MEYKIISIKQLKDTLVTTVEYQMENEKPHQVDIMHFQPKTKEEIHLGIVNRFASEKKSVEAEETLKVLSAEIEEKYIGKPLVSEKG